MVALFSGVLHSKEASAQVAKEESMRKKQAQIGPANIATAYILGASRSYPIMQLDMKENIQNCTNGQYICQTGTPGPTRRRFGAGPKGSGHYIEAAQHSISNFALFARRWI